MFKKRFLTIAITLFVVVNTSYFWEGMFGFFVLFALVAIALTYLMLVFQVLRQIYFAIKEKFRDKVRLFNIGITLIVLTIIVIRPFGLINYSKFESENVLVADREGAANCMTTLLLKESGRFKMRSVCFGVQEDIGTYSISNDTVKLNYLSSRGATGRFKYAVLDSTKTYLKFYNTKSVTDLYLLHITLNKTKLH